jgi:4-cresol dehydrogenase (hydroxylating)
MTQLTQAVDTACEEWRQIVGEQHVHLDSGQLDLASTATYPTDGRVVAIVAPANTEQVSACLRVAQKHKVPVYPISTGKNWGYGSRVPPVGQAAILDLGRMSQVLHYDHEMGTVTVEPGVTFRQLEDLLESNGRKFFMSAPGTTPDASVIGNALERGWGFGPYSDRFDFMCGMQVVLPDGEIVETGMERFPGANSGRYFRWGVGPWFDGMFTQSNLGVVTRMTVFLAPTPSDFVTFVYRFDDPERMEGLVDALRDLKLKQILRTNFKIQNFYRQLMGKGQFPYQESGGAWTLSPEVEASKRKKHGIGVWNGAGALYCWSAQQAKAETEIVRAALEPHVDALLFFDRDLEAKTEERREQVLAETGYDLRQCFKRYYHDTRFIGVDRGNQGMAMAYWRKSNPAPDDPQLDRDKVGFIWVDPIIPFRGRQVREATDIIANTQIAHGFEPNIGLNCVTERSIFTTGATIYDREEEGRDQKAIACARETVAKLTEAGYILGRLTTDSMSLLQHAQEGSRKMQERIKAALDPNRILAPGRYE